MLSEIASGWIVFSLAILGLGFFAVMAFLGKFLKLPDENDYGQLFKKQKKANEEDGMVLIFQGEEFQARKYTLIFKQIEKCIMNIFFDQVVKGAAAALVMWLVFTSWFIFKDTYLLSFIAFFWGIAAVSSSAFIVLKFSMPGLTRYLIDSSVSRGNIFCTGLITSAAISSALISIIVFFYMLFMPLSKWIYMVPSDGESWWDGEIKIFFDNNFGAIQSMTKDEKLQHLYYAMLSYAMGSIFLRDGPKQLAVGFMVGQDLAGKLTAQHLNVENISLTLKKAEIVGSILGDLQVAVDSVCFISTMLVVITLLTAHTSLTVFHDLSPFYYPLYLLTAVTFLCCGVTGMALLQKKPDEEPNNLDDQNQQKQYLGIKAYTAGQIRLQLILVNSLTALVLFIVTQVCMPETSFSLGDNMLSPFYFDEVYEANVIWCLEIGLLAQSIKLVIAEYYTSHKFPPIKEVAQNTNMDVSLGMIQLTSSSHVGNFLIMITLATTLMICYVLGGFYGIAMGAMGMTCTNMFLLTTTFFGSISSSAENMAYYGKDFSNQALQRIVQIAYAARNWRVFLPIVNCGGVFMINLVSIGLIDCIGTISDIVIWDAFVIYGFVVGSGFAYFLKGHSVLGIKQIMDDIINDERNLYSSEEADDIFKDADPEIFITRKIPIVFKQVLINLGMSMIAILFVASMFGGEGLIGYVLGLNLIGLHLTYLSILKYYGAENTRYYIQNQSKKGEDLINGNENMPESFKNAIQLDVAERTLESNALLIYLIFNMLFVLHGARVMSRWGAPGRAIRESAPQISQQTVSAVENSVVAVENIVTDGEASLERQQDIEAQEERSNQESLDELREKLRQMRRRRSNDEETVDDINRRIEELQEEGSVEQLFYYLLF